ncbi:MAG: hypothetical protein LUD17_01435 [Bacteroidales bacterium]|nr:hypothetical protein [Bacteroidales bacterium]
MQQKFVIQPQTIQTVHDTFAAVCNASRSEFKKEAEESAKRILALFDVLEARLKEREQQVAGNGNIALPKSTFFLLVIMLVMMAAFFMATYLLNSQLWHIDALQSLGNKILAFGGAYIALYFGVMYLLQRLKNR